MKTTSAGSPADFCGTIYECLGIDPNMPVYDQTGRPHPIAQGARRFGISSREERYAGPTTAPTSPGCHRQLHVLPLLVQLWALSETFHEGPDNRLLSSEGRM